MRQMRLFSSAVALLVLFGCATYDDTMNSSSGLPGGRFGDSDIVAVLVAANEGEVEQGNLALTRASSPAVRDFGRMLVNDHTSAAGKWRDLASARNITVMDNATSSQQRSGSQQTIAALSTYSGSSFDRMFVQAQVDNHQWTLSTIDAVLPAASRDVRDLLNTQRASVVRHLDHARNLLSTL